MTDRSSDLALIEVALDAARVVDDFVRSVVELAGGELGGGRDVHRSWTQRKLGSWLYGERDIARSFASLHDRDQLLKAAGAADELVAAVEALGTGGVAASAPTPRRARQAWRRSRRACGGQSSADRRRSWSPYTSN